VSTYQLSVPAAALDLPMQLRIETTEGDTSCINVRATTIEAKRGADYGGLALSVDMSQEVESSTLVITRPNACPFSYVPQGKGIGKVVLSRPGLPDISDSIRFPDEVTLGSNPTVTAVPSSGSKFVAWAVDTTCDFTPTATCHFLVNDSVMISPVFDLQ
jgi:hypothetical protein